MNVLNFIINYIYVHVLEIYQFCLYFLSWAILCRNAPLFWSHITRRRYQTYCVNVQRFTLSWLTLHSSSSSSSSENEKQSKTDSNLGLISEPTATSQTGTSPLNTTSEDSEEVSTVRFVLLQENKTIKPSLPSCVLINQSQLKRIVPTVGCRLNGVKCRLPDRKRWDTDQISKMKNVEDSFSLPWPLEQFVFIVDIPCMNLMKLSSWSFNGSIHALLGFFNSFSIKATIALLKWKQNLVQL